jgi:hypothetical protein
MPRYAIIRKADRIKVYEYEYVATLDLQGFPLSEFDHEQIPDPPVPEAPRKYNGRRVLTRLEFIRLFTALEREDLYNFATNAGLTNAQKRKLSVFFEDLKLADEVNLDDTDIQAGVPALQAWGLIGAGRAVEVLRG